VRFRPIKLAEIPNVDNVTVKNEIAGFNGIKIFEKLVGMTTNGAKVNIR
jgi:hypothetical protein